MMAWDYLSQGCRQWPLGTRSCISLKNGLWKSSISHRLPNHLEHLSFSLIIGSTSMSGSSFMSLPEPWNIGIKADHLSWDMLFHRSRQDMLNVYPQIIYRQRFHHVIGNGSIIFC